MDFQTSAEMKSGPQVLDLTLVNVGFELSEVELWS